MLKFPGQVSQTMSDIEQGGAMKQDDKVVLLSTPATRAVLSAAQNDSPKEV